MSFGLEALFEERLEVFPAEPVPILHETVEYREAAINSLIQERDELLVQVMEQASTIEHLQRRVYAKVTADAQLPVDVSRRLNRLENEYQQLRARNIELNENLKAAESETATLRNSVTDQSRKVKGAMRKIKNAKEVTEKEEAKAKGATNDKQRHIASERKMRAERNEALAALAQERKTTEDLRAELHVEQSSNPHMRDTEGTNSNFTTFVIPVHFRIRRIDYYRTMRCLRSSPNYLIARVQDWHKEWLSDQEERRNDEKGDSDDDHDEYDLDDDLKNNSMLA